MSTLSLTGAGPEASAATSFSAAVLADSPLLYWRLGEPSGTTAADASGNARTGTYAAGATLGAAGATTDGNTAVSLSGTTTGKVTSAFNPFTAASSRTFMGWANRTNSAANHCLFGGDAATTVLARLNSVTDNISFFTDSALSQVTWTAVGAGTASYFLWHITYNDATKVAELFINAVSKGQLTQANSFTATPGNFKIGTWTTTDNDPFLGLQDEVAIFPSVLSGARITAQFNAR